jgi:hypothetical protein
VSTKNARRLLFAVAWLTLPVPFFLGEPELAPVVRLAFLSALVSLVFAAEGGLVTATLAGIGWVQALVWSGLLLLGAALIAKALARIESAGVRTAITAAIALVLLGASLGERYDTPLSSSRARSSLLQLFQ